MSATSQQQPFRPHCRLGWKEMHRNAWRIAGIFAAFMIWHYSHTISPFLLEAILCCESNHSTSHDVTRTSHMTFGRALGRTLLKVIYACFEGETKCFFNFFLRILISERFFTHIKGPKPAQNKLVSYTLQRTYNCSGS